MRLQGKSAIVTGSSRGIGAEIASVFAAEGAKVMVNCLEDVDEAREVVSGIKSRGGVAELCVADVRDPAAVEKLVEQTVKSYGRVDVLVNNAGIIRDALIENMTFEQWNEVISTNLTGVYNCSRAVFKRMKEQRRGRIISISSVVAEMGNIGQANYASSKAGVIGLTRSLALEFAKHGILVNAVAPGFCATKMVAAIPPEVREKIAARIPLKRFGEPREIANTVLFLASDEASYITGQVVSVNGGLHL